ncbi:MAG: lipopolysaccharide transport periplasmic protein LptA [Burkholderiales bacterium]|jgi:lipopolysaccharide export system protein LptA|nr:lipopolysaccharide transport periplasmic protein LptA [Burkholderiales bacterium]
MKFPLLRLLLCAACALNAGVVGAEKADAKKPMNIEADALRYDDLKQTSVFSGNVVLTRGSIIIKGARIEVRQDPQGYQFGVVTAEAGQRAFFRQKRDGEDEYIEGESETIEYDGRADVFKLIKDARLRRLRGAQVADVVTGNVIQYNSLTDVFTVDGSPQKGGERVRATLTPRSEAPQPAAPRPALPLRNDDSLSGGRK